MKKLILTALIMFYLGGCASEIKPQNTFIEAEGKSPATAREALPIEGGWEFQFPAQYNVQKVAINHDSALIQLAFYARIEGRWEYLKSVNGLAARSTPSEIPLNVMTDAIRVLPKSLKEWHVTFCQFYMEKPHRTFSIPLEKPPFIK